MKNELNLEPLLELLEKDADLESLLGHLHNIYFCYTKFAFKASNYDGEVVCDNAIIALHWIEKLIHTFEKMKISE